MGRVFDFNMSRLCPAAAAVLPRSAPGAALRPRAGDPAGAIPDLAIYCIVCIYMLLRSSEFGHGLRFFRIPRYASRDRRGIPGARRSPYTALRLRRFRTDRPRRGYPRPRAHTPLIL